MFITNYTYKYSVDNQRAPEDDRIWSVQPTDGHGVHATGALKNCSTFLKEAVTVW